MTLKKTTKTKLLTKGPIFPALFKFALPFMGASFLQAMYGFTDILIISRFSTPDVLAGVANGIQILWFWIFLASGLTMGGTILIGQFFGAKQNNEVQETITTMFSLFLYVGLIFCITLYFLMPYIITLLQVPAEAIIHTKQYLFASILGIIFTFSYHSICAVLRGLGDSKSPLLFVFIACIVNVILDLIFIGALNMGALGASLGTVLAQALSVILGIIYLKYNHFEFSFRFRFKNINKQRAFNIFKIGVPISLQDSLMMISFMVVLSAINKLGLTVSAGAGITDKLDMLTFLPPMAVSGAVSAMVSQNIGARKFSRAKRVMFSGILLSLLFSGPIFILTYFMPRFVIGIISSHPNLITVGASYLQAYSPDVLLLCVVFSINAFLNGCGKTNITFFNNTFANVCIRIPLAFMATDIIAIGLSLPTAAFSQIFIGLIYFYSGHWKKALIKKL